MVRHRTVFPRPSIQSFPDLRQADRAACLDYVGRLQPAVNLEPMAGPAIQSAAGVIQQRAASLSLWHASPLDPSRRSAPWAALRQWIAPRAGPTWRSLAWVGSAGWSKAWKQVLSKTFELFCALSPWLAQSSQACWSAIRVGVCLGWATASLRALASGPAAA
jgi:hypothetical protein